MRAPTLGAWPPVVPVRLCSRVAGRARDRARRQRRDGVARPLAADVSDSKGFSLQNFGYAIQWWAFSIAALVIWVRVVRDRGPSRVGAVTTGGSGAGARAAAGRLPSLRDAHRGRHRRRSRVVALQRLPALAGSGRQWLTSRSRSRPCRPTGWPPPPERSTRYRVMAFVTGVVLLARLPRARSSRRLDVPHMEPCTGFVWVAHGYLYLVYVIFMAMLGREAALAAAAVRAGHARRARSRRCRSSPSTS